MLKQPLFGEDSSPHITSMLISSIVTLICWIIFCVMCFVIQFKPKTPEYKEVQIVLSSTPVVEKEKTNAEDAAAAVEETVPSEPVEMPEIPKPVETPVAEAKVETPKNNPEPPKTTSTPKVTEKPNQTKQYTRVSEPETYGTFLGDEIDFGTKKPSVSNEDWDNIEFFENESSQPGDNTGKVVGPTSGWSGTQGFTDNESEMGKKSSPQQRDSGNSSPSEETLDRLKAIRTSYKKSTGNVDSIVTAETTKNNGYVNMKMSDGTTRALMDPITPVIILSPEAASLIDSKRTVKIEIRVLNTGNVPRGEIVIDPISVLPQLVRDEIYDQLSTWRFEPGSTSAKASFEYTIEKR